MKIKFNGLYGNKCMSGYVAKNARGERRICAGYEYAADLSNEEIERYLKDEACYLAMNNAASMEVVE